MAGQLYPIVTIEPRESHERLNPFPVCFSAAAPGAAGICGRRQFIFRLDILVVACRARLHRHLHRRHGFGLCGLAGGGHWALCFVTLRVTLTGVSRVPPLRNGHVPLPLVLRSSLGIEYSVANLQRTTMMGTRRESFSNVRVGAGGNSGACVVYYLRQDGVCQAVLVR